MISQLLKRLFGLQQLDEIYALPARSHDAGSIFQATSKALKIRVAARSEQLDNIPTSGPVVVVANHPTGILEGLALKVMLDRIRKDSRTLSHSWFSRYPTVAQSTTANYPGATGCIPSWRSCAPQPKL